MIFNNSKLMFGIIIKIPNIGKCVTKCKIKIKGKYIVHYIYIYIYIYKSKYVVNKGF